MGAPNSLSLAYMLIIPEQPQQMYCIIKQKTIAFSFSIPYMTLVNPD